MGTKLKSLKDISVGLRSGELTAESLVQSCMANYERLEPALHAYKSWDGESALKNARAADTLLASSIDLGPLMGIPVSVKDLYGVPGFRTFAGSPEALPKSWEMPGPVIQSALRQLALVMGKSHTVEFAFGGIGINAHWGTPVNPWAVGEPRIPGGSSSGAGVSLAQGSALLAFGTDTAGSVRIPASLTGTVGFKPTWGRWPGAGIVPLSSSLDTPGLLARSVEDVEFAFSAIDAMLTGKQVESLSLPSMSSLRIGVPDHFFWDDADPAIVREVEAAIAKLESAGAKVSRITLPRCDEVYGIFGRGGLAASELCAFLADSMPEKLEQLDPVVRMRVEAAESVSSVEYLRRRTALHDAAREAAALFTEVDVIATPTVAISPPRISELADGAAYRHANMMTLRNTSIANLMGLCAISMPVGKDGLGMPIGMQLMGGPHQDAKLLAISILLENKLGKPVEVLGTPALTQ
ncbi:amidase [Allopusillimonas ginsengisoli]|uniref:amidase n=1 Tax=Allopusillimonas ginsengisoli TaxID=453575 RepID=UPI0039C1E018